MRYNRRETRSGAKHWSVDVFLSVVRDLCEKRFFSRFFEKVWSNFEKLHQIALKLRNFDQIFSKSREKHFLAKISWSIQKHIY